MSSYPVLVRRFGERDHCRAYWPLWPLDDIASAGLATVPGCVLEFSEPGATLAKPWQLFRGGILDDLLGGTAYLDLPQYGRPKSAVIEWIAYPAIAGLPYRLRLLDDSGDKDASTETWRLELLKRKRFIEEFAGIFCSGPLPFSKVKRGHGRDHVLSTESLEQTVEDYHAIYREATGSEFPATLRAQFEVAIDSILRRWSGTPRSGGETAPYVSISVRRAVREGDQEVLASGLVFGPALHPKGYGCYSSSHGLDDIDAGIAEIHEIDTADPTDSGFGSGVVQLRNWLEAADRQTWKVGFVRTAAALLVDSVDHVLPDARLSTRVATALVSNGSEAAAIAQLRPSDVTESLVPRVQIRARHDLVVLGTGLPASPGVHSGRLFTCIESANRPSPGMPGVFVATSPGPEQIPAVMMAQSLVFGTGGATSHVAVIARSSGRPCVLGVPGLHVDTQAGVVRFGDRHVRDGEWISVDGNTGRIYLGQVHVSQTTVRDLPGLEAVLAAADRHSKVRVRANADSASAAATAFAFGATGIGLCRIEHLLLQQPGNEVMECALALACCISTIQHEVLSAERMLRSYPSSPAARANALSARARLNDDPTYQTYLRQLEQARSLLTEALVGLLRSAAGRRVTVRLFDPPPADFVREPTLFAMHSAGILSETQLSSILEVIRRRDPFLGLRGARLCRLAPEFTAMQIRAVLSASEQVSHEIGHNAPIDLLVPSVIDAVEIATVRRLAESEAASLFGRSLSTFECRLGAMIEIPRAALCASSLAEECDFFSIGTNDLTQLTWCCSRDHSEAEFLNHVSYADLERLPFGVFDRIGVGQLVRAAVAAAKTAPHALEVGVCGEHAAHPEALAFFSAVGVDYVSCPSHLIPAVRLACAQASIDGGCGSSADGSYA
jgi:pyruvate,orthophosphate dikinase